MPVVEWEPQNLDAPVVVAFSDARDNFEAIKEIDAWAREHGLVRARESWLAPVTRHNRTLFRGACYPAPAADDLARERRALEATERRRNGMPPTTSSDRLHEAEG
jgi:hypothetical protein